MKVNMSLQPMQKRVEIELERERHERVLHDETRAGISASEEFRVKDARESTDSACLKRSRER